MKWAQFIQVINLATDAYLANPAEYEAAMNAYLQATNELYRRNTTSSSSKDEQQMYDSAAMHADTLDKDIHAFQLKMAQELNNSFGLTFSPHTPPKEETAQNTSVFESEDPESGDVLEEDFLADPSSTDEEDEPEGESLLTSNSSKDGEIDTLFEDEFEEEDFLANSGNTDEEIEADIVIVGGGPIGYAQAMGFKKLNPDLKIVVLEKYEEFQRKHTLVMQAKYLQSLMKATDSMDDPELQALLQQLRKSPHIRTNVLQEKFKAIAERAGVITKIEEVKPETLQQQLLRFKPKLIIGADGTHSVINQNLFPKGNQKKHEVDFAMQVRYEIDGDGESSLESTIAFYQSLARQGIIATEQVGRRDPKTGKTPVTVQLIIHKEDYVKLKAHATAKNPIRPFSRSDRNAQRVPKHLKQYITSYFADKVRKTSSAPIDHSSIRISVNELPATQALKTVTEYQGVDVALNGDSALGLSYFKGLNAGLEALAMFFNKLKPAIQDGLEDKVLLQNRLTNYQNWFKPYSDKKVEEVKQYSAFKVRPAMRLVKLALSFKGASHRDITADERPMVETQARILAHAGKDEKVEFIPYPHRSYDPNIRLGQFAYIPISYTLKKIAKLFIDYFKPYKDDYQFIEDFKQPLSGLVNTGSGLLKIIAGLFTLNPYRIGDGIFSLLRGAIEIATFPLAWLVKPLTRGFISLFIDEPKIEEGKGIKKLVDLGEQLLSDQNDDDFSPSKTQNLLGVCNDLHRKFDKGQQREQSTDISSRDEGAYIAELTDISKSLSRQKFRDYLSIFGGRASNPDSDEEILESSVPSLK